MAEGLVAAELRRHAPVPDEAEAERGERRRQQGGGGPDRDLGADHPA